MRAKRLYESRWIRRLEDMEGQANYLAEWQALGDWQRGDAYLRAALAVTTEDLQRLAQRYLDPEEVANLAVFLCSAASAATTGAAVRADGGVVNTIA